MIFKKAIDEPSFNVKNECNTFVFLLVLVVSMINALVSFKPKKLT